MKGICCKCGLKKEVLFYEQVERKTLCICHQCLKEETQEEIISGFKKSLEEIEGQLYAINSRNISMRWIGLKQGPTEKEIFELNKMLGFIIKEIRTLKETGKLDTEKLHEEHFGADLEKVKEFGTFNEAIETAIKKFEESSNKKCSKGDGCYICESCKTQLKKRIIYYLKRMVGEI